MRLCSFCNRPENEVKKLVGSEKGPTICNKCLSAAVKEAGGGEVAAPAGKKKPQAALTLGSPKDIKAYYDQYVISQDKAKVDVSVAVYNHYKRRELSQAKFQLPEDLTGVEIAKSNILLLGPSGTGKTELARATARMLGVPFYVADATKITQAGYVGDDVETMLQGLMAAASGDVEKAEWGIIFIDEFDKLARKSGRGASGYRDVSGEGAQQALLKLLEGSKVSVPKAGAKINTGQGSDEVDTSNILFIGAGSFDGVQETITRRINKQARVGFGADTRRVLTPAEVYSQVREEDLLEFGIIPELLGRMPVLTTTLPLGEDDLVRILTEPRNALVKQYRSLFAMDGIDLQFDIEALRQIGREANKRPTGARALRSIIEEILNPYSFEYRGDVSVQSIQITREVVEGKTKAEVVKTAQVRTGVG